MHLPRITVPNTLQPIDNAIDAAWDSFRGNPVADRVFYTASEAANFSMIWHTLAIGRAIAIRDPRVALRASAALAIESALVNGPIKSMFKRERPMIDSSSRPLRLRQPRTSSFPSGHASAAVVAASYLTRGSGPAWRWAVRGLAAVVATSRIHVQIHHASDVAGGAIAGWAINAAMRPILERVID